MFSLFITTNLYEIINIHWLSLKALYDIVGLYPWGDTNDDSAYPLCLLDVCFAATSHLEMGFPLPQTLVTAGNFVTTDHLGLRWKRLASGLMTTINVLAYWLWVELFRSTGQWRPDQVRVSPSFVFEFKICCMFWRLRDKRIWPF